MSTQLDSVQERLRHWREAVVRLSVREFHAAVNAQLPPEARVSLGTVSNHEQPPGASRSTPPRADYVAAVKRAFPELRLEWLLLGEGAPGATGDRVAAAAGRLEDGPPSEGSLRGRVLEAYPDLGLLSPESSALFLGALTRYAMGEPSLELGEQQILELAADLRWLLLLPLSLWGYRHEPDYDTFAAYSVALLHALTLLMPASGAGDPIEDYAQAPNRALRDRLPVGFPAADRGEGPAEALPEAPAP